MRAGFSITGTLPTRTELANRIRGQGSNALASSIVLVCRPRPDDAPSATRRQFLKQLQKEFPADLATLQQGNIAPVDLAQASIGLGMSVFSRYSKVLEEAGILLAKNGKVRLLKREELPESWNPAKDDRTPDGEATQHLIQTLDKQGETGAAILLAQLGDKGEICRDLAYRLYVICDRQGWTQEAISYNSLVKSIRYLRQPVTEKR